MSKVLDSTSQPATDRELNGRYPIGAVLAAMTGSQPATEFDSIAERIADPNLAEADVKALQARIYDLTTSLAAQLAEREQAIKAERTAQAIAAAQHPAWCAESGKGVCDRGDHMSDQSIVPATGAGWTLVDDEGAMFPFMDVYAETRRGTDAAVTVGAGRPNARWVDVRLSSDRARDFAENLHAAIELARQGDGALLDSGHTTWCDEPEGHGEFGCFSASRSVRADRSLFDADSAVGASAHLDGGEGGRYTVQVSVNQTDSDFAEVDLTVHEAAALYSALDEHARQAEQG